MISEHLSSDSFEIVSTTLVTKCIKNANINYEFLNLAIFGMVTARSMLLVVSTILYTVVVLSFRPERLTSRLISHSAALGESRDLLMVSERTRAEFEKSTRRSQEQSGGAGGSATIDGLIGLDKGWSNLKSGGWKLEPANIVSQHSGKLPLEGSESKLYDVAVCGGTLGIFYALALQKRGIQTAVIERGMIAGRPQEWNISGKEMDVFLRLGIFTKEELDSVIAVQFNPVRVGFKTDTSPEALAVPKGEPGHQFELYTRDVLNLGILPNKLIAMAKTKFEQLGGTCLEQTPLQTIAIYDNLAALHLGEGENEKELHARVVVDCMGNGSPISKQIRGPVEPDGVCIVVGGCARGYDAANNTYSDLIYTDTPITSSMGPQKDTSLQYFWEAFPTGSGPTDRTVYLFTYMDAKAERPSVADIYDDYWRLLPRYQGVEAEDLEFQRLLYGLFPTYRDSPLRSKFSRLLPVGDASGIQSPLSFGGFGSLTRHLDRIVSALEEALVQEGDMRDVLLQAEHLSQINAYQPNLSACWMFQRSMSCPIGTDPDKGLIVGILSNSFRSMEKLGDAVMKPFLQDVLQFVPLLRTLSLAGAQDLLTPLKIVPHVGLGAMGDFFKHFFNMGLYTALYSLRSRDMLAKAARIQTTDAAEAWRLRRLVDAWKFGCGLDYEDH